MPVTIRRQTYKVPDGEKSPVVQTDYLIKGSIPDYTSDREDPRIRVWEPADYLLANQLAEKLTIETKQYHYALTGAEITNQLELPL